MSHGVPPPSQQDEQFWSQSLTKPVYAAWSGLAFERVCMQHLPQIKKALGIAGVSANAYSWIYRPQEEGETGVQIDMLIDRDDQVINLCEMKFSNDRYVITKQYDEQVRHKASVFQTKCATRKAVRLTMITTYGIMPNPYAGNIHNTVVMDDLFAEA